VSDYRLLGASGLIKRTISAKDQVLLTFFCVRKFKMQVPTMTYYVFVILKPGDDFNKI
jgi:hypothetical protein